MIVHLVDGTYELFRHFYGLRRFNKGVDRPYGAVVGVLQTVLQMIDSVKGSASRSLIPAKGRPSRGPSDAYIGVATDHVIESFRIGFGRTTRPAQASSPRCSPSS